MMYATWALLVPSLLLSRCQGLVLQAEKPAEDTQDLPLRDIFLFAGQSNCVGTGFQREMPQEYIQPAPNLKLWWHNAVGGWKSDSWDASNLQGQFGPEVTFTHEIARKIYVPAGESFGVVKVAKIMTSLYNDWSQSTYKSLVGTDHLNDLKRDSARWAPGMVDFEPWLFANLVDSSKKALQSDECAGRCKAKALIWVQGESDAQDLGYARAYENALHKMVAVLRKELASPDLKVVLAKVAPDLDAKTFPAMDIMLEAQQNFTLAEGPERAISVSAAGLEKMADKLHYDTAGQIELGKRLAAGYLGMLDQEVTDIAK